MIAEPLPSPAELLPEDEIAAARFERLLELLDNAPSEAVAEWYADCIVDELVAA